MFNPSKTACLILLSSAVALANEPWEINSQEAWEANMASQSNIELKDGMVLPTAKESTFLSKINSSSEKRSASSIVFEQSMTWLNWEPIENIGTQAMANAPVMLSLGPDDYWMFALHKGHSVNGKKKGKKAKQSPIFEKPSFPAKDTTLEGFDIPLKTTKYHNEFTAPGGLKKGLGGYHAWQSRDMKNWVHHGPITEHFSRWMTTAEYVDGKAYFYYDFPNDQDPHVYVDKNLTDGTPGKNMGMAFKDPSDGSDCAFIRDLDGNFHVIYEDWSPINARMRSWDSPLAGHAVSKDGLSDFSILPPAVDLRTTPTGKTGTYTHPSWVKEDPENYKTGEAKYAIHEPNQPAFGDWASISIGGQYYIFGDYDPEHGKPMSVAWFTSSSLDKEFKLCGNIGEGHPDPDVCFAEGRFYLATQQQQDFISTGPWVDTVEVRVGVDTSGDQKINEWSDWQVVKESYDHTPGFAKQIKKTSAAMDLSALPEGFGFQFEVKINDTTDNASKPEINKITVTFDK
ncbi:hypothetical protein OAI07_02125 [Akkermansiaceae bacterium]|nr:hypothetical protein [Akkermansiaceae bacterium]